MRLHTDPLEMSAHTLVGQKSSGDLCVPWKWQGGGGGGRLGSDLGMEGTSAGPIDPGAAGFYKCGPVASHHRCGGDKSILGRVEV